MLIKEYSFMRIIILISSFLVLVSCIVMSIVQIKEKKLKSPFMLLIVFTFFTALFMILKMFGVL